MFASAPFASVPFASSLSEVSGVTGDLTVTLPSLVFDADSNVYAQVVTGDLNVTLPSLIFNATSGKNIDYTIVLGKTEFEIKLR